jgi:hypothetical protein
LWLLQSVQGKDQYNQAKAYLNYPCRPQQHVHDLNSIAENQAESKKNNHHMHNHLRACLILPLLLWLWFEKSCFIKSIFS